MKKVMIAALVAAQLPAAAGAAPAAEPPREEAATPALGSEAGGQTRLEGVELAQADGQAPEPRDGDATASPQAESARQDKPKKRKSTGDKILTGAAVVLGIGALAVGGLLVAIFVN
jgi:hypothetical protein